MCNIIVCKTDQGNFLSWVIEDRDGQTIYNVEYANKKMKEFWPKENALLIIEVRIINLYTQYPTWINF